MFYGLSVFLFHVLFRLSEGKDTRELHAIFQHLPRAFQRQRAAGVRHRVGAASRPAYIFGIRITDILLQPGSRRTIINTMPHSGNQFYLVSELAGMLMRQTIECFPYISGQCIPVESCILISCPQRKSNITTILRRSIL